MKAKDKLTPYGCIVAGHGDTAGGEPITESSILLAGHLGKATGTHLGRPYEVTVVVAGASLAFEAKDRRFVADTKVLLQHAIDHGLLTPAPMDFEQDVPEKKKKKKRP